MAGKEVPHKKPAKIVNSTAFFLLSAKTRGVLKNYPFSFRLMARNVFKVLHGLSSQLR
jgi:hypothetical protein